MESLEEHHKKADIAADRPSYRDPRWDRAVKVYTVNQESKYLLVQNVHALGVTQELLQQFSLYGAIEEYRLLDEYPSEPYTDVYWIKFAAIDAARMAKKKLDNRSFFGKNLHVCYAPEYESVQDTREKLQQRREAIARMTSGHHNSGKSHTSSGTAAGPSVPTTPTAPQPFPLEVSSHTPRSVGAELRPQNTSLVTSAESCDSHVTQLLPHLPAPPFPYATMQEYPSTKSELSLQDKTSGQPTLTGQPNLSSYQVKGHGNSKSASEIKQVRQDFGQGGSKEEGVFHASGLSTEDRVAAYLAGEGLGGTGGGTGEPAGGKRGTTDGDSRTRVKKRRRI